MWFLKYLRVIRSCKGNLQSLIHTFVPSLPLLYGTAHGNWLSCMEKDCVNGLFYKESRFCIRRSLTGKAAGYRNEIDPCMLMSFL